jgi:single-strand DNA-binding protein
MRGVSFRNASFFIRYDIILVKGTISTSQWKDRQGESHTQISINADSIAFVNAGKKEEQNDNPKKAAKKGAKAKNTPQPPQDAPAPDEKDMPF